MKEKVRVRFAPSPTGGLHLGGVRTVLYNYLFAKKNEGSFIVRIEDTDQNRYVEGAEDYIFDCLDWCGLTPDESVRHGGDFGPYRQSERKTNYHQYAEQLVQDGNAYYAFDTAEELEKMRQTPSGDNSVQQYDHRTRMNMRNSLTLSTDEVNQLLAQKTPYVIRIKMPEEEQISFTDLIRGKLFFDSGVLDDKVLLKADGMPTYHLAVVVDDFLMQISHVFRGEEWLPSAPVHILLWKYLFGEENMPAWAHLPLLLGPNGKLSKRDGAKYGFPVYALQWTDPTTGDTTEGFKEKGFLPQGFINFLALLGWNDGSEKEIFTLDELIHSFSLQRVHNSGAHFDYEKAKWYNHEWMKKLDTTILMPAVNEVLKKNGLKITANEKLEKVIDLVKERCTLLPEFYAQASFFFQAPETIDSQAILPKWNEQKKQFFEALVNNLENASDFSAGALTKILNELVATHQLKPGEVMLPLRVMLVGGKFGPGVFDIMEILGKTESIKRIQLGLSIVAKA